LTRFLRSGLILLTAFVVGTAQAAYAEDYTRIDLTDSTIGFSSPGNAYGPWIYQDLRVVFVQPGQGAINFEAAHEANGDIIYPTHGEYFAGGYTHDFNRRVWAWANFGWGTDRPYARTDAHIELAYKTTPDLKFVMNTAEDWITYVSGQDLKLFQIGPTYFYDTGQVQLRYLCEANSGAQTRSGLLAAWDITPTYRQKYTITGLFGPQTFLVGIPGYPLALFDSVGETYNVSTQQQLGRTGPNGLRWGVEAGGFYTHQTSLATSEPLYTGRGATLGLWTTFPQ
jgi:YaiO family outer membrane protein